MSVGEKIMGFFLGLLFIAVGAGGIWGLMLGLKMLCMMNNKVLLANLMLGVLALPVAYGVGLGIAEYRHQPVRNKVTSSKGGQS